MPATIASQPVVTPVVLIVDDDESVRSALDGLFKSVGLRTQQFASAHEFLAARLPDAPGCLILDIRLPGMNGFSIQTQLADMNVRIPVIFITGHGDVPMSVRAMKAGAVDFLPKPFREQDLLDAVHAAIERDRERREKARTKAGLEALFHALTAREREVLQHVVAGLMNKQVAAIMGLSEITVKVHRGNVMKKMRCRSFAELVRKAQILSPVDDPV